MKLRIIFWILVLTVVIIVIVKFGKYIVAKLHAQDYLDSAGALGDAETKAGKKPSYSELEYKSYAVKLKEAEHWYDDDEEAFRAVFNKMRNGLDVVELIKAFGIYEGRTLSQFIADVLSTDEIETYVNSSLRGNGISFQF